MERSYHLNTEQYKCNGKNCTISNVIYLFIFYKTSSRSPSLSLGNYSVEDYGDSYSHAASDEDTRSESDLSWQSFSPITSDDEYIDSDALSISSSVEDVMDSDTRNYDGDCDRDCDSSDENETSTNLECQPTIMVPHLPNCNMTQSHNILSHVLFMPALNTQKQKQKSKVQNDSILPLFVYIGVTISFAIGSLTLYQLCGDNL